MGMHKNIDRYDHAIERYKNGTLMEKYLALTIYYAFPHEQDAYAHQFYSMLINEKPFSTAETCINNFQYYKVFAKNFNGILQNIKEMEIYIKEYGFTINSYKNYINKQIRRFHNKLKHAYDKYMNDKEAIIGELNHHRMIRNMLLLEEMKNKNDSVEYDLCLETFYKEFKL